jgi:hypothetical protein
MLINDNFRLHDLSNLRKDGDDSPDNYEGI